MRTVSLLVKWALVLCCALASTFGRNLRPRKPLPCTANYGLSEALERFVDLDETDGCNFLKGQVPYVDNRCVNLLEQGPCRPAEWLVIDDDTDNLVCVKRPCGPNEALKDDRCISMDNKAVCPPTYRLIINEHGEGECECPPGYLYHEPTERCYLPYTQGPCPPGYIIRMQVSDKGSYGKCTKNPCPREKMTPLDSSCRPRESAKNERCYTIGRKFPCREGSYLLIEPSLSKPFCLDQKPNSIIPRFVNRACHLNHNNACVRECDGLEHYAYTGGRCADSYVYHFNYGNPICLKTNCKRVRL